MDRPIVGERRHNQSRELSRRIRSTALKRWAVFTAAFVVAMGLLNATVVPRMADWVADSTSEWRTLQTSDYSLRDVLDGIGLRNDDGTYDLTKLDPVMTGSAMDVGGGSSKKAVSLDFDLKARYGELYVLVDALEETGEWVMQVSPDEFLVVVRDDMFDGRDATVAVGGNDKSYFYTSFTEALASPYFGSMTLQQAEYALDMRERMRAVEEMADALGLADRYIESIALSQLPLSGNVSDWQMVWTDEGVLSFRDLSVYHFLSQLKMPVILGLYFAGCGVIVLLALRRSLRSFDELAGAVGDIMADREKPVELSADLSPVQDELNGVRLAALADERAAVAAERRKDELVAYLAHDVRTPLTSVIGYLSLLDEAPDLPAGPRQKYTRIAFEKACRLEGLIDEFFEITRYNLQAIPIERGWVSVRLFCEQVAEGFYVEAEARDLTIRVEGPDSERFFVDADKLARALGNVMRNAIAYADPGTTVELSARAIEAEDGPAWELAVTDQGREISQAHLKSIFDKFYREDGSRGTKEGGTGLGLAIAQEVVRAHNGTICAASADGTTTFTIILPRLVDPVSPTSDPAVVPAIPSSGAA